MIALFWLFLALSVSPFKSKNGLAAENAALRYQLIVLQRRVRSRIQLTNGDRLFLVTLYRWFPSVLKAITIVRPETLVRWHRAGFRRYWRWKSRFLGGRPKAASGLGGWVLLLGRSAACAVCSRSNQAVRYLHNTYVYSRVLTAPVLVAFVVLGLRALNNQPLSRLQTTAVLTVDVIEDSAAQRSRFSRNGFSGAENSSAFLAFATASAANFLDSKLKRVT